MPKKCSHCGEIKPHLDFHKDKVKPPSENRQCKVCTNFKRRLWRQNDIVHQREREAEKARRGRARLDISDRHDRHLNRNHGMTVGQYWEMLNSQGGVCAICGKPERAISANPASNEVRMMSVDHDHRCCVGKKSCGKCVRGLLCSRCNAGLGNLNDDVALLTRAIKYLAPAIHEYYEGGAS